MRKLIFATFMVCFGVVSSATVTENIANGLKLRAAVENAHSTGQLNAAEVIAAMRQNPNDAALILIYAIETNAELIPGLVGEFTEDVHGAVIDAVLVSTKNELGFLDGLLGEIAKVDVELASEIIYAVAEVFPAQAKKTFSVLSSANPNATNQFEDSYTEAIAIHDAEGLRDGNTYETYEPEQDVSPS